jgi:hypothetical protein
MLGASNLHLSRIEKEKRAASAAAKEAAAARKAALVEAAWCRILKAAGYVIDCSFRILDYFHRLILFSAHVRGSQN